MKYTIQFWNKTGSAVVLVMNNLGETDDFIRWARTHTDLVEGPIVRTRVSNEMGRAILDGRTEETNEAIYPFLDAWYDSDSDFKFNVVEMIPVAPTGAIRPLGYR